jgi:two-component system, OmpR family, alkaline phosphatase synthesis response regulator PhoP
VKAPVTSQLARKILIADYEEDVRNLIRFGLQRDGHEVITASDGAEALELAHEHRPHMCMLEVMMPKLGGIETLKEMRSDPDLADVKVILLTSRAQRFDVKRGFDAGADDYVVKPFDLDNLRARVQNALA